MPCCCRRCRRICAFWLFNQVEFVVQRLHLGFVLSCLSWMCPLNHLLLQDTFQVDFVVQVADNPRAVDNNRGRDYSLPLQNPPSAEAVMRSWAQAAVDFERQAMQVSLAALGIFFWGVCCFSPLVSSLSLSPLFCLGR